MRKSNKPSGSKWIPGAFRIFKASGPKQFRFHTRYYDQEKEEFEQRLEESRKKIIFEKHSNLKKSISFQDTNPKDEWLRRRYHKDRRSSNVRLWIILVLILAIFVYLYKYLDEVFK